MLITLAGTIGSGKSSLTSILSDTLGTTPYYEPVKNNPVLPLFYKGNEKVAKDKEDGITNTTNPYTFLLQIYFLNMRFKMIKQAMQEDNSILDRSIYEDSLFMQMNYDLGTTTETELNIYNSLLQNMMEELPYAAHKKSPDLMILIKVSLPTMLARIKKRGREFEQVETDTSLKSYYKNLLKYYDKFEQDYSASDLLVIDGDRYNFVESKEDLHSVLKLIMDKLLSMDKITKENHDEVLNNA